MLPSQALWFTAFAPSGDALAAPVIKALLEASPGLRIYAWGGPKMEEAGAELIENTASDGAMGLGALAHAFAIKREQRKVKRWSQQDLALIHISEPTRPD